MIPRTPSIIERDANEFDRELHKLHGQIEAFIKKYPISMKRHGITLASEILSRIHALRHYYVRPMMDEIQREATKG